MFENLQWEEATDVPALAPGAMHVWQFPLWTGEAARSLFHSYLSSEERARAARFHFPRDRKRYVAAHGLLRVLLGRYIGVQPAALRICCEANAKPALMNQPDGSPVTFNLSHAGSVAVCAVGRNRNIGIDVEKINGAFACEDIAGRYFSPQEVSALRNLPAEQRANGFFACWTRKEAYTKALGAGLHVPLESFSVSLVPGGPARFLEGVDPKWEMIAFCAGRRFPGALVYDGGAAGVRFFRLAHAMRRPSRWGI